MNIKGLTAEQKKKALACKTPEELLALAKEEGYDLSEEELTAIAGGDSGWCGPYCATNTCDEDDW